MDNISVVIPLISAAGAILALIFAMVFFKSMMKNSEGTPRMIEIAQHVRDGAMAYLSRQYKVVGIVFVVLVLLLTLLAYMGVQNPFVPVAFLNRRFLLGSLRIPGHENSNVCIGSYRSWSISIA
jgi:K(+)-stimulated pyrophosphate-energized sodium pump